jgi:hypothetical protein
MGGSQLVRGSRMAMPAVGPRPGITPTMVPSALPKAAYIRLVKVSAFANPDSRRLSVSIPLPC